MGPILVTGAAGFIGFHVVGRLLDAGKRVVGIDNLNDYYDVSLKQARLAELRRREADRRGEFTFHKIDLVDRRGLEALFRDGRFDAVVHLAAQAGVRYSLENPAAYIDANVVGFLNMLECCRYHPVKHLVYASSSSVYGLNREMPFAVSQKTDSPVSLYGATKKSNELFAHAYSHLFGLPCTGLRFFTVYGPWGRPDMAVFSFTKAILEGRPIPVFNFGKMRRDFTYVDDIAEGVVRTLEKPPRKQIDRSEVEHGGGVSLPPARVYNIGNREPEELTRLIELLEKHLGKKALLDMQPMQPGDVLETFAETGDLSALIGFVPRTPLDSGIERFVEWYKAFYLRDGNQEAFRAASI